MQIFEINRKFGTGRDAVLLILLTRDKLSLPRGQSDAREINKP